MPSHVFGQLSVGYFNYMPLSFVLMFICLHGCYVFNNVIMHAYLCACMCVFVYMCVNVCVYAHT